MRFKSFGLFVVWRFFRTVFFIVTFPIWGSLGLVALLVGSIIKVIVETYQDWMRDVKSEWEYDKAAERIADNVLHRTGGIISNDDDSYRLTKD